ncbi:uncharacterized protein LOC144141485 [Haemaphysalis longicornis]
MKGLLNLLAVLAALLSLTRGCGFRPGGNRGQALLRLGQALGNGRLTTGSSSGVLASTVSSALGGGSGGGLLGGLGSLTSGSLSGALLSGNGGLGSSSATPGLQASLGTLTTRLGGATGGSLVLGFGKLAATHLGADGSSGATGSSSTLGVSGQQLQQSLLQNGQLAARGFLLATGASTSAASSIGRHIGGSSITNTADSVGSLGRGALLGVVSSEGTRPSTSGVSPGGSPLQGVGQVSHQLRQATSSGSLVTSSMVTNSATTVAGQLVGSAPVPAPGVIPSLGGSGPVSGALNGNRGPVSNGVATGSGILLNQGQAVGQSIQQAGQLVTQGLIAAAGGTVNTALGGIGNPRGNSGGVIMDGVTSQGRGVLHGGAPSGSPGFQSSGVGSGGSPLQGVGQVSHQLGQATSSGSLLASSMVTNSATTLAGELLGNAPVPAPGVIPSLGGSDPVSGALNGNRGPVSNGVVTAPSLLGSRQEGQGHLLSSQQITTVSGGGLLTAGGGAANPAADLGAPFGGTSGPNLPGAAPSLNVVSSGAGVSSRTSSILTSNGASSGINIGQRLGPEGQPQPISQVSSGQSFSAASAAHHSAATMGVHLGADSVGNGGNMGQVPGQGPHPTNQVPSGGSVVSVSHSSSSHSSSSWHARFQGNPQGQISGSVPSPGGGAPGGGYPIGAGGPGSTGSAGGGSLLQAIAAAGTGRATVGGLGSVPAVGLGGLSSSGTSAVGSSSVTSAVAGYPPQRPVIKPSPAATAGIALGVLAGTLAVGAIGSGLAGAIQSGVIGGGRRGGGCSGGGCRSRCGRKRRSVPESKVPAQVLDSIPMNFKLRY